MVFNTIDIELTNDFTPRSSKIGGKFISEDEPGAFLAQINLAELPRQPMHLPQGMLHLPTKGWLQFFIGDDEELGKGWPVVGGNGTVRYLEELNGDLRESAYQYTPVRKESGMSFEATYEQMSVGDFRFVETELGQRALRDDELWEKLYDERHGGGSKLFGYPAFVQGDRRAETTLQKYDALLFQLDSYPYDRVMWGDSGVGNFFIPHDKLMAWDFSDILFTWDCC